MPSPSVFSFGNSIFLEFFLEDNKWIIARAEHLGKDKNDASQ